MSLNPFPDNPHAVLVVAGSRLDSWENKRIIEQVSVELTTNQSSKAEWRVFDPDFKILDSLAGAGGINQAEVLIFLNYGRDLGQPLFKGLLAEVERDRTSTVFTAFDMAYKMKREKRPGYHNKKDDLDIMKALVGRNGLSFAGPKNPLKLEPHKSLAQDEQSDWEHLLERAHAAGLMVFTRQDTVFAEYPARPEAPALQLEYKKDFVLLDDFDFSYKTPENLEGRPRIIKQRGRGKGGKRLEGESSESADAKRKDIILRRDVPGKHSKEKLSARARAQKKLDREHSFTGHLRTLFPLSGARLDVRRTVRIKKMGALFSRDYITDTVWYEFAPGKLEMRLELHADLN